VQIGCTLHGAFFSMNSQFTPVGRFYNVTSPCDCPLFNTLIYRQRHVLCFCAGDNEKRLSRQELVMKKLVAFAALLLLNGPAAAYTVIVDAFDSGWYRSDGYHDSTEKNYFSGIDQFSNTYRNFFVFDFTDLDLDPGTLINAELRLFNPSVDNHHGDQQHQSPDWDGYQGPAEGLTYVLYDVTTAVSDLRRSHTGRVDIFDDLGDGVPYRQKVVDRDDNGTVIAIDLDAAALVDIQFAVGGLFAIGGTVVDATGARQHVFSGTGYPEDTRQLVLEFSSASVSEPASLALVLLALAGAAASMLAVPRPR
jgi:hypothetical protein